MVRAPKKALKLGRALKTAAKLPARDSVIKLEALETRVPVHDNEDLDVDMDTVRRAAFFFFIFPEL